MGGAWGIPFDLTAVIMMGFFHLKHAFEDDDITHAEGSIDSSRDIQVIHEKLQLKDEKMIEPVINKLGTVAVRKSDKKL
ncbi:rCG60370, partial [Rattus norvegicus]